MSEPLGAVATVTWTDRANSSRAKTQNFSGVTTDAALSDAKAWLEKIIITGGFALQNALYGEASGTRPRRFIYAGREKDGGAILWKAV